MTDAGRPDPPTVRTAITEVASDGTVRHAGYDLGDLARRSSFEETVFLLHHGRLPSAEDLEDLSERLAGERELDPWIAGLLPTLAEVTSPLSALRTGVSATSAHDPDGRDHSTEADERKAVRLIARIPTLVAAGHRLRTGGEPVPPDPKLPHAANVLYTLDAREPDEDAARALEGCMILHADHGLTPSTMAARVVASNHADMHAAITAAVGALGGPLEAGESRAALRMLEEVGETGPVADEARERLDRREPLPGFRAGHDPRAGRLREIAGTIAAGTLLDRSEVVTEVARDAGLSPTADLFAAIAYRALGIPAELFTCLVAMSRIAGWTAHVREQLAEGGPIGPAGGYVGPPARPYVSLEDREAAQG